MVTAMACTLTTLQHFGLWTQIFIISSIYWVLRALQQSPVKNSKELFTVPPQNSFFEALLHGKSRWSTSIPPSSINMVPPPIFDRPTVPLPKKLFL